MITLKRKPGRRQTKAKRVLMPSKADDFDWLDAGENAQFLARCKKRFDDGDKVELLEAVDFCLQHKMAAPEWVVREFASAMQKWNALKVTRLGAAFGVRRRVHLAAKRKRRNLVLAVYHAILERKYRERKEERTISHYLFDALAEEFKISRNYVKNYYAEGCKLERALFEVTPSSLPDIPADLRAHPWPDLLNK